MKRLVAPVLAVIVVVAAALALHSYLRGDASLAALVVEEVRGEASVTRPDQGEDPLRAGMELGVSDSVRTADNAYAVLSTGAGTRIRIEPRTVVRVEAVDPEGVSLDLADGLVRAEVRNAPGTLRIAAGESAFVTSDADFAVGMRDGRVAAETTRGDVMVAGVQGVDRLGEGSRLVVRDDGPADAAPIPEDLLLQVDWPEARKTREEEVTLRGRTEPHATVEVRAGGGRVEVVADEQGGFVAALVLAEGDNTVEVRATNALGQAARADDVVLERDTTPPSLQGALELEP